MNLFELSVILFLAVGCLLGSLVVAIGVRQVSIHARKVSRTALKDLLANDYYEAVSMLVPAYNVEGSIVASVRSMLNLQHPQFEVIVINDGSADGTMSAMIHAFGLMEVPIAHDERIRTRLVVRMYRSVNHANLTVIDKLHGGRADALNAGLNLARRPLVCTVDAGMICDPQVLVRACRVFMEDASVIAAVGATRSSPSVELVDGHLEPIAPRSFAGRIQANADIRNSVGMAAAARMGTVMSLGGCTTIRRQALRDIGGYDAKARANDMDVAIRLHSRFGRDKRIAFIPEPMCWTPSVSDIAELGATWARRTRGIVATMWTHRRMMLNPRDGRIGMFALPAIFAFDVLTPVVEAATYGYLAVSAITGHFHAPFAALFAWLTAGYPALVSHVAVGAETMSGGCYARPADRIKIALVAIAERIGVHQVISVIRTYATFTPSHRIARAKSKGHHPSAVQPMDVAV